MSHLKLEKDNNLCKYVNGEGIDLVVDIPSVIWCQDKSAQRT